MLDVFLDVTAVVAAIIMLVLTFSVIWFGFVKAYVMPPCAQCRHAGESGYGGFRCEAVCDRVNGRPEDCELARHNPRCRFEKKEN